MDNWVILDRLSDVILEHVEGCVVEIGLGRSTPILAKHAKTYNRKHYACDSNCWICKKIEKYVDYGGFIICNQKSSEFMKTFTDTPALVLIDGNHFYDAVKKEVDFFLEKLAVGGVMFLHDTYMCDKWYNRYLQSGKWWDTYKVRQDLEKDSRVWTLTFPYTASYCGLTMVLKKDPNKIGLNKEFV